jgi:hypothetical protein
MMSLFTETRKTNYMLFYVLNSVHFYVRVNRLFFLFFYHDAKTPSGPRPPHYRGFMFTLRHTTLGRTPVDESSARRTDLYLTIHNTHKRETSMPRRDSNPQSQQSSGRRPTSSTARTLGSAHSLLHQQNAQS